MTTPDANQATAVRPIAPELQERLQSLKLDRPTEPGPRSWLRGLVLFLVLLLGGIGTLFATSAPLQREEMLAFLTSFANKSAVPECEVIVVKSQPADDFILESTGFIIPRAKVHLNPSVPGKIVELPIREGQILKKGDVVVRIDDGQYRADVEQGKAGLELAQARLRELKEGSRKEDIAQAKAVVQQAKARHELMKGEFDRATLVRDSISTTEYEKAKSGLAEAVAYLEQVQQALALAESGARPAQLEVAQAEVDRAQAALAKTQHWLESTVVRSPITGTILQKTGELGEFVRPEALVQSLCVVADLNDVEVEVDVQERDLALIKVGQPCRLSAEAHGDRQFEGRVDRILPIASRQRGAVQVRVAVLNPKDALLPDMNCRVVLSKTAAEITEPKSYRVPKLAVAKEAEKAFIFVLRDSIAHKVPVEVGAVNSGLIEITDGVKEGDRVLLARNGTLRDGQPVNVSEDRLN
jgi:HlyD family secretion protein